MKKIKKDSNFSSNEGSTSTTKIKVIGIGGGGCSIISEISTDLRRVDFVAANTDKRALKELSKKTKVFNFGEKITSGFGTGMNFELGKSSAQEDKERIKGLFEGQDMCILVASLGGGTGSGAVSVFAKMAKDMGLITYGIFTLPFEFEGSRKMDIANEALKEVKSHLNAITVLPNENIFKIIDKKTPLKEALSIINKNLQESLEGLIETIYNPGIINVDFADLKTILGERGKLTYLNTTLFDANKSIDDAVKKTTLNPFYSYTINGAGSVLFNITGGENLGLKDVSLISEGILNLTGKNSKVIFGISKDSKYKDKVRIMILAVGCEADNILPEVKKEIVKKEIAKKEVVKKEPVVEKKPKLEIKNVKKEVKKVEVEVRRNALETKKESDEIERDIINKDEQWETPAFLRRK